MQFLNRDLRKMVRIILHTECGDIPHVLNDALVPAFNNALAKDISQTLITKSVYYSDLHPFISVNDAAVATSLNLFATAGFNLKPSSSEEDGTTVFFGVHNPLNVRPKHEHRNWSDVPFGGVGGRKYVGIKQLFDVVLATNQRQVVLQIPAYYDNSLSAAAGHKKHAKCAERSFSVLESFLSHSKNELTSDSAGSKKLSLFATIPFAAHAHLKQWKEFLSSVNCACSEGTVDGLVIELQNEDTFGVACDVNNFATALQELCAVVPSNTVKFLLGPMQFEKLLTVTKLSCVDYVDTSTATLYAARGNLLYPLEKSERGNDAAMLELNAADNNRARQAFLLDQLISPAKFGQFSCSCYVCRTYTVSYLAHLFASKELLGETLASIHNLNILLSWNNRQSKFEDAVEN